MSFTSITQEIPKPSEINDDGWKAALSMLYLAFRRGELAHVFVNENCYLIFIADPLSNKFISILTHHTDVKPETLEEFKKMRSEAQQIFTSNIL